MDLPKRKVMRLSEYDYSSPGAYFVTICTKDRRCILSDITVGAGVLDGPRISLTSYGTVVEETLQEIVRQYDWLSLDHYVIMPNHIHLLLRIEASGTSRTTSPTVDNGRVSRTPAPTNTRLPMLISTLKRFCNQRCGTMLWQRSYHEHVIRGEDDYREIRDCIEGNPGKWTEDRYCEERSSTTTTSGASPTA